MQAGNIVGTGVYKPDYIAPQPGTGLIANVTPFWMVSGVGAEVEVDTETGHVRIAKLVNTCDIGKPINPKICESQISGAAMMQLGFTMFEKMQFDGGQVTNASLADYKVPGIHDLPEVMENEAIDAYQSNDPFGGKGVGEALTASTPTAPASPPPGNYPPDWLAMTAANTRQERNDGPETSKRLASKDLRSCGAANRTSCAYISCAGCFSESSCICTEAKISAAHHRHATINLA
jgi:hypothetical protein